MSDQQKTNEQLIAELESARKQIEKLASETKRLEHIETLFNDTQRLSKTGGWDIDLIKQNVVWTEEVYRIHGVDPDEYDPNDIHCHYSFYHPEDGKILEKAYQRAVEEGKPYDLVLRFNNKQGERLWVRTVADVEKKDGKVVRVFGHFVDITEQKRTEEALRENQEKYRLLHESAGIGIGYYTTDGKVISYNKIAAGHLNSKPEELVGKSIHDLFPADAAAEYMMRIRAALAADRPIEYEDFVDLPAGGKWFLSIYTKIPGSNGRIIGVQIHSHDITKRKVNEQFLVDSEARFHSMFNNHSAIMLLIEPESGQIVDANKAAELFYGYSREKLLSMCIQDINQLSPEEVARHRLKAKTAECNIFAFSHKLANDEIREVEVRSTIIEFEDHRLLFSIIHDITERKQAEDKLRESESRWQFALEGSGDGVWDWNAETDKVFFSGRWKEMLGYEEDEIGDTFDEWDSRVHPDDKDDAYADLDRHLNGETDIYLNEHRMRCKDGSYKWILDCGKVIQRSAEGKPLRVIGTHSDITERKRSEERILASEHRFRSVFEQSAIGKVLVDTHGKLMEVNQAFADMLGYSISEMKGHSFLEYTHHDDIEKSQECVRSLIAKEQKAYRLEKRYLHRTGAVVWANVSTILLMDELSDKQYFITSIVDITEQKQTEEKIRESEQRFRRVYDSTSIGLAQVSLDSHIEAANHAYCDMLGYSEEELIGKHLKDITHRDIVEENLQKQVCLAKGEIDHYRMEKQFIHKSGRIIYGILDAVLIRDREGKPLYALGSVLDITERKQNEEKIRNSEKALLETGRMARVGGWEVDVEKGVVTWTTVTREVHEVPEDYEPQLETAIEFFHPDDRKRLTKAIEVAIEKAEPYDMELRLVTAKGNELWAHTTCEPIVENGKTVRLHGTFQDITARKQAQETLAAIFDMSIDFICISDSHTSSFIKVNPAYEQLLGCPENEILGTPFYKFIHPDDIESSQNIVEEQLREGRSVLRFKNRNRTATGEWAWIDWVSQPVPEKGIVYFIGLDITESIRSEEQRIKLEEQLQQSQKMESIGRLAGGVAHDFNNLLTGITGNVSLAMMDLSPDDPLLELLSEISQATDSAANLTRQLLAFSRKQIIEPKVINLNELIENMQKMLTRLIGEDVDLQTSYLINSGHIKADPGQVEQILVNLAVNARDAMPNGGRLTIETAKIASNQVRCHSCSDISEGDYITLTVSDTGQGMDEKTRQKVFDPFYTTKKEGKGTGLGLATVYGIVMQHGGHIDVRSKPGEGTTFCVSFPVVMEKAETITRKNKISNLPRGSESVLVVEDESMVRNIAIKILERHGYTVHSAKSGKQAIEKVEDEKLHVDLLLTDIVMPNMNGKQLADRLLENSKDLKVLFTSGYTEDVIAHHGILDEGLNFIGKPYSPQDLAKAVRRVLNEKKKKQL